jgi:uncharacterized membrane protein YfhO
VLVASELDYPGWVATVDGESSAIWRADNGLRSLMLTAGEHDIFFTYEPLSVKIGVAVSLTSLVILGFIMLRSKRTNDDSFWRNR